MKNNSWIPFFTLFRREIARFSKVVAQTVLTPLISAALYLMIFGVSLGEQIKLDNGLPYLSFLIPGLVMMGCLNNAFQNSSSTVIAAKFSGDLEDIKVAPLSCSAIIAAMTLAAMVRGLLVGLVTFLVGEAAFLIQYGELMPIAHPLALMVFLMLGSLAFANVGIIVAFWAKTFDQMSAVGGFVLLPLIYLGGVFFSVEHLPSFWRAVSLYNPLLYMINGVRYGILGISDVKPGLALLVSVAAFLGTLIFAVRRVRNGNFQRW
jgi:ABC-2 type transport system permease protein